MAGEDATLKVGVEADSSDAVRDMRSAADAAASLADSFREIASVAVTAARALTKVEQGVTGTARSGKAAAQSTNTQTAAMREQASAAKTLADNLLEVSRRQQGGGRVFAVAKSGDTSSLKGYPAPINYSDEAASLRALSDAREANIRLIRQTVEANIAESKAARQAATANKANADALLERQRQNTRRYAEPQRASNNVIPQGLEVAGVRVGSSFGQIEEAANRASGSIDHMRDSLFTARFALHDISNATGIAGAAILGFNALTIKAAADYETAMAAIQRTSGATVSEMAVIQDQFVDLAQTVPAGFQNLAQIGELAGQLNIPSQNITSFTETVAQFVSSTDVATQQAAEAFGRLDALLPDVQGNYNALGSSILNVGVNSVATESAIISTTTQIAAAGAQARFTSDEIIGLAASYASLGIAPEAARGSTIRIFSEIATAVQQGGAELDEFARLSGQSAQEFQQAWTQGDASQVFLDFLKGLQSEGTNAEAVLRELGITGVRDINALLRLSQNIDVVTQSFGYATAGFEQGTQLAEAFGITSETLNARLDLLGQSIQALFAELGSTGTGPIKEFVNGLIDLIKWMTELSKNPVAQWIAVFGGLFTLLAGGVLILTSIVARMGAMAVATRTVNVELRAMAASAATSGTAMGTLQSRLIGAGVAMTQFKNILRGLMVGTAITAGITLFIAGMEAIGNATKSAADKAKDAFGDLSGLSNALMADTKVYEETGRALGFVEGSIETVSSKSAAWVTELENATGAQTNLGTQTDHATSSVEAQTLAIGENTAAWLANELANNEAVENLIKGNQKLAGMGAPTADVTGAISAAVKGDTDSARAILEQYRQDVQKFINDQGAQVGEVAQGPDVLAAAENLKALENVIDIIGGSLDEASAKIQITDAVMSAVGVNASIAAGSFDELGAEVETAASKMDTLRSAVEQAFGSFTAMADWGAAVGDLFYGLAENGATSFNILGEVGQANLGNLQQAIITTIAAGEQIGVSAVDSVAALFLELQRRGIDTANLLASLASIPGIGAAGVKGIQDVLSGTKQLSGNANQLQQTLNGVADRANKAAQAIGSGGRKGLGGASKAAAQELRTLVDYASDLEKVFSRAFEIRFSAGQGMDKITSQWIDMKEAIADANQEILEAQARMQSLTSDNNILMYFKTVADSYGDSLRSADISAEIAKNNAELAEEQKKAADATAKMDKNLVGNSKSAIANRADILDLVSGYQDLIKSYAASGMDQTALALKTQQLRSEFVQQGLALGYSYDQLQTYAAAFDDVALAIQRVPRNITVSANTNPAIQALNEFLTRANASKANVAIGSGDAAGAGWAAGNAYGAAWTQAVMANRRLITLTGQNVPGGVAYQYEYSNGSRSAKFFGKGGYTGDMPVNQEAGIVHGREFVINAQNTDRLGLPFLNALNSGKTPVATQQNTTGIQVVELSATDRALLAAAGNVTLTMDGRVVAQATNNANFVSAKRGSN